jgi:hypothetical protein
MATVQAQQCRRKFLRHFPGGFDDATYIEWERDYKADAHAEWLDALNRRVFRALLDDGAFADVAARAVRIESRRSFLFSFEKMALRDGVKSPRGARLFAEGLYAFLHGRGSDEARFTDWVDVVAQLPRRQTRVLTWPVVTVFGFIAQPDRHIFLKPNVTRTAAARYGVPFEYHSRPQWSVYKQLLDFSAVVRRDLRDLGPRDLIDVQSFIWVQGSEEYAGRSFRPVLTTRVRDTERSRMAAL